MDRYDTRDLMVLVADIIFHQYNLVPGYIYWDGALICI